MNKKLKIKPLRISRHCYMIISLILAFDMQKIINFALILLLVALAPAICEADYSGFNPELLKRTVDGLVKIDYPEGHQSDIVATLHSLEDANGEEWPITDGASKFSWLLTHIPAYKILSVKLHDPRYILVLYSDFDYRGDRCMVYKKTVLNVLGKCFVGPIASAKIVYLGDSYHNKPVTFCVIPSDVSEEERQSAMFDCRISAQVSYFDEYSTEFGKYKALINYIDDDYICQRYIRV